MNINSCLDSASVKMTCEDYIDYMQSEMEAYEEIESRINTFLAEEESYSNSITNIKTQMEDYSLVLTTLRISNEEDISDAKTLMDLVGNETMDGRIIFREQNEASIEASDCRSKASSAKKNANGATQPGEYTRYQAEASYWEGRASAADSRYNFYKKKEQLYDEINTKSSALFMSSYNGRNMAYQLLAYMKSSFVDGNYDISPNRQKLRDGCIESIKGGWKKNYRLNPDKVYEEINNVENMNDIEFEAFKDYLISIGIALEADCTRDNLKEMIQNVWIDGYQNIELYDDNGNVINSPFKSLTYEQRKLYVLLYEDEYPIDASQMQNINDIFKEAGYSDWEEDLNNIKFLTYTAPEPYKSIYLQNVDRITEGDLTTDCWPHASNGKFYIPAEKRFSSPKDPSKYEVFFHETTHCIDYYLGYDNYSGSFTEYYGLKDYLEEDVRKRINEKTNFWLNQGEYKYLSDNEKLFIMYVVEDCIMNQVDYELFGEPNFKEIVTNSEFAKKFNIADETDYIDDIEKCYKKVQESINDELESAKALKDCYGGFTGNTFGNFNNYHPALINDKGGQYEQYRVYWLKGGMINDVKQDDGKKIKELKIKLHSDYENAFSILFPSYEVYTETKFDNSAIIDDEIIKSTYNLEYNNATASELLAISMENYMTRSSEVSELEYLYPETKEQLEAMLEEMYD